MGSVWCTLLVQVGAPCIGGNFCSLVQFGALWSKVVNLGAPWCKLVQFGATWPNLVQLGAS